MEGVVVTWHSVNAEGGNSLAVLPNFVENQHGKVGKLKKEK